MRVTKHTENKRSCGGELLAETHAGIHYHSCSTSDCINPPVSPPSLTLFLPADSVIFPTADWILLYHLSNLPPVLSSINFPFTRKPKLLTRVWNTFIIWPHFLWLSSLHSPPQGLAPHINHTVIWIFMPFALSQCIIMLCNNGT